MFCEKGILKNFAKFTGIHFVGVFLALFRFTDLGLAFQSVLELETIFCNNYMLVTENFISY